MKSILPLVLSGLVAAAGPASAQTAPAPVAAPASAGVACKPRPSITQGPFNFFLQIAPSDSPLDVWCKLQLLDGEYRFTIFYPTANAFRTTPVEFDGVPRRSKVEFAEYLKSMLPTSVDHDAEDTAAFVRVLGNVLQGASKKVPEGSSTPFESQLMAIPADFPEAKRLAVWEPLWINLRSIRLYDVDYDLSVQFVPSVGRFVASTKGAMENMVLRGWRGHVLSRGGVGDCPENIPFCDLPEVVPLDMAWRLDKVILRAKGTRLSGGAKAMMEAIAASAPDQLSLTSLLPNFDPSVGEGEVRVQSGSRYVQAKATGSLDGTGTSLIVVTWGEDPNHPESFVKVLDKIAGKIRGEMIVASPDQGQSTPR